MSGKGRDDPRNPFPQGIPEPQVGYAEDDVAMTQKLSRPKLPRIEKIAPTSIDGPPTMLRPKQGGAVDASALKRVRRISGPNHVAIRNVPEGPASFSEPTVARSAAIPHDAYPHDGAPSTVPEEMRDMVASSRREAADHFDDATQRGPIYIPDDFDVESIRSSRDVEPRSLVTKQVPADVVKILRSRAALENELVMENGLPVLIPESQASPGSRESSEALMLTKLAPAPTDAEVPRILMPEHARPSPLAETRMMPDRAPQVAAQGGPPAPKPSPQLHTLPLGMKPADFLAGLAKAEAHAAAVASQGQPMQPASMQSAGTSPLAGTAAMTLRTPSAEMALGAAAAGAAQGSSPRGPGSFASSGALPVAQPSSGVFPQGAQPQGPQRFPSGQMSAVAQPGQAGQGAYGAPASMGPQPSGAYPSGVMQGPANALPSGTYPPGMMQAPAANATPPGAYPPGMMQAPPGQGMPPGTYPPGMMQAPPGQGMPPGTYPPGMMQAPPGQGMPPGTYPPGMMQAPPGQGMPSGTYPPGMMQAPPGQGMGTFPPGSMSGPMPGNPQATFPPGSGPVSTPGADPNASAPKSRGKSTAVLLFLAFVVVLAAAGAWLTIKGKRLPWKHGAIHPEVSARVV